MSNPTPVGSDFVEGIHEAALYTNDLAVAERFWTGLGFQRIGMDPDRHVFFRAGNDVLLIFDPTTTIRGGNIPPHGATGPGHIAFSVRDIAHLESWKARLEAAGVAIEAEREWPTGGRSIYFRDPAGNSIELITRGSWLELTRHLGI